MTKFISKVSDDYALLDKHTGELLEYRQTKKVTVEEFIMVFFSSCPKLLKLSGLLLKVMICCWKFSTFNKECAEEGNLIHNNEVFKNKCKNDGVDAPAASIDNAISALCKKGLLLKRCRGEYMLNPLYFFKGSLSNRSKIQFNIVVGPDKK